MQWTPEYERDLVWIYHLMRLARDKGKTEYIFPLWVAHLRGLIRLGLRKMIPKPLFKYLKKRLFPYQKDIFNPIYLDQGSL
jgi:hypothetical protein